MKKIDPSFSVGLFLATRDIRHSNWWTTALIIFVMALTFLNMVLIGGILLGLAEGMVNSSKQYYSSDILISPSSENYTIDQTSDLTSTLYSLPSVSSFSSRYTASAKVEYGYLSKTNSADIVENVSGVLVGIDPDREHEVTNLAFRLIEGDYLRVDDINSVLLGQNLFTKYSNRPDVGTDNKLETVEIGSIVRVTTAGNSIDLTVKGIIATDNQTIDSRIFVTSSTARGLLGRSDLEASELAIDLIDDTTSPQFKDYLISNLANSDELTIQTGDEAVPGSSADITKTFRLLGNLVGVIALIVGAITIFIVIFVNAITRRKYIGILKGIGISASAIEISYVLQSLFYALAGVITASLFILGFLKPFLDIHPLVLPIAEGRLAVTPRDLLIRGIILIITSLISGFVPARLVTKQNTLDSILGR